MHSQEELEHIAQYVMPDIPENKADLAVVFGTRHGVESFCSAIHSLWERRMFQKVIITGGRTQGQQEAEANVIAKALTALGVPEEVLILEVNATNTGENVIFSREIMASTCGLDSIKSLLVIGKICSLRRYMMTLERHWPAPERFACPINYFGVEKRRWYEHEEFRRRVFAEFNKIPEYIRVGYLREISVQYDETAQ
jgi:uncharacterized SAM-binding protein YcdF (DUF218 family)